MDQKYSRRMLNRPPAITGVPYGRVLFSRTYTYKKKGLHRSLRTRSIHAGCWTSPRPWLVCRMAACCSPAPIHTKRRVYVGSYGPEVFTPDAEQAPGHHWCAVWPCTVLPYLYIKKKVLHRSLWIRSILAGCWTGPRPSLVYRTVAYCSPVPIHTKRRVYIVAHGPEVFTPDAEQAPGHHWCAVRRVLFSRTYTYKKKGLHRILSTRNIHAG
jgi:hypothetical protein